MTLIRLAEEWFNAGQLSQNDRDEILYMVNNADFDHWRPLLYVVPYDPVRLRLKPVPMQKRGGFGPEYVIEDLVRVEFDLIEL